MNKQEKQVEQAQLNKEKQVLRELKAMYQEAVDSIGEKVQLLQLDPLSQSKAYQAEFQKVLKSQIATFLDLLHDKEYDTIEEFLKDSYTNGFVGAMYSIQAQGIPLILPIAQEQVVKAIQLDSKIKVGLYQHLGNDIKALKKTIRTEVARGISQNMGYSDISRNISNASNTGLNNAMRIARTESHRVKSQAAFNASTESKKKGADVVKQWDSSMDGATRSSHRAVDGEIRELDKPFSNKLMYAGDPSGAAAEVINCRCVTLTRAKWALDEEELNTLKERAEYYGLDKSEQFEDYKKKYLKAAEAEQERSNVQKTSSKSTSQEKALEKAHKDDIIFSKSSSKKESSMSSQDEYIRFGAVPENGKSVNWFNITYDEQDDINFAMSMGDSLFEAIKRYVKNWDERGVFEEGISVFKKDTDGLPKIENLQQLVTMAARLDDTLYIVSGTPLSIRGTDNEPLLKDAKQGQQVNSSKFLLEEKIKKILEDNYDTIEDNSWFAESLSAGSDYVYFKGKKYSKPKASWDIKLGYKAYRD